jgi:hypothetical protein
VREYTKRAPVLGIHSQGHRIDFSLKLRVSFDFVSRLGISADLCALFSRAGHSRVWQVLCALVCELDLPTLRDKARGLASQGAGLPAAARALCAALEQIEAAEWAAASTTAPHCNLEQASCLVCSSDSARFSFLKVGSASTKVREVLKLALHSNPPLSIPLPTGSEARTRPQSGLPPTPRHAAATTLASRGRRHRGGVVRKLRGRGA